LKRFDLLLGQILHEVTMVQNILVNLLNHDFQGLIAISAAEAVEIEVEELEL